MVTAGSDDGVPRLSGQVGTERRTAALPVAVLDDVTADDGHLAETCGGPAEHTWPTQRVGTFGHDRDEEVTGSVAVVGKGAT